MAQNSARSNALTSLWLNGDVVNPFCMAESCPTRCLIFWFVVDQNLGLYKKAVLCRMIRFEWGFLFFKAYSLFKRPLYHNIWADGPLFQSIRNIWRAQLDWTRSPSPEFLFHPWPVRSFWETYKAEAHPWYQCPKFLVLMKWHNCSWTWRIYLAVRANSCNRHLLCAFV